MLTDSTLPPFNPKASDPTNDTISKALEETAGTHSTSVHDASHVSAARAG